VLRLLLSNYSRILSNADRFGWRLFFVTSCVILNSKKYRTVILFLCDFVQKVIDTIFLLWYRTKMSLLWLCMPKNQFFHKFHKFLTFGEIEQEIYSRGEMRR
jgi:hypothetical protein